jgi:hypothetical protein
MRTGAVGGPIQDDNTKQDQFTEGTWHLFLLSLLQPWSQSSFLYQDHFSTLDPLLYPENGGSTVLRNISIYLHGVTSQKIATFTLTAVRNSVLASVRYTYFMLRINLLSYVITFNFSLMYNINYDESIIKIKSISSNNVCSGHNSKCN